MPRAKNLYQDSTRVPTGIVVKWVVALLVPLAVFTFLWSGEEIVNGLLLNLFDPNTAPIHLTMATIIQMTLFVIIFYATIIALAGYLVATDRRGGDWLDVWLDVLFAIVVPLFLIIITNNLLIGLGLGVAIFPLYRFIRAQIRRTIHARTFATKDVPSSPSMPGRKELLKRARMGGFWLATAFALLSLVADVIFIVSSPFPMVLIIWVVIRTLLLPVAGYFLGQLGGLVALRSPRMQQKESSVYREKVNGTSRVEQSTERVGKKGQASTTSDRPLQSKGAWRFYLVLLGVFVIFYPVLDPILFSYGSAGRITSYADLGYYVILALGLNIVVGFAGLLDLGYVAFFVIGTYVWAMLGSPQFTLLTGIVTDRQIWSWFFWPILLLAALIAALWGVLLGAPTLRLRGDYLAIVTLGFGEIVPIVFLNMDKYTNGTNGIAGVYPPVTPCIMGSCIYWNSSLNPAPFYYLILILIGISIFANVRLRDSRIGRAWIAIREDEIAASSSGINLVNTKLLAFAAGAFFSGIAGAYHASKLGVVNPTDFSTTDSIMYLAMVVIGGLGSIPGVIVGAVVVYALNVLVLAQLDSFALDPNNVLHIVKVLLPNFSFSDIRNLLFGLLLIIIMIFRPEGLIPSTRRRRELHTGQEEQKAQGATVEAGALDVPPGSVAFEEEMHVE